METVGNAPFGSQVYHGIQHIARTCHYETYITGTLQHQCCGFHKVFRAFLHSDTSEEGNHLLFGMIRTRNILQLLRKRIHRIMHGKHLSRILMILIYHCAASKLRYTHDAVCIIHSVLLHRINGRIHLAARTVKVRCMHMDAERLATYHFRMYSGRVCQPVVSMNNVEFLLACHNSGYD